MSTGRDSVGTVEDLHASASRITGLDDFGEDDYRDGLAVLLESYVRDAALTPLGNKVKRAFLRGALVARQLSEAAWRQHPEHVEVRIERPIFVTGLPRTGTTALHRLLSADPANQGLEVWLTEVPQPRPPRETWADNPVFQGIQAGYQQHHVEHPEFMGVHHMSAEQVEECWQLLRQSMRSISFVSGPRTRTPSGLRTPVASISVRVWMGIHQTLGMPANCMAPSSLRTSASQSSPLGHRFGSFSVTTVSNIESGAGSVGESNRPAFPKTRSTSGN